MIRGKKFATLRYIGNGILLISFIYMLILDFLIRASPLSIIYEACMIFIWVFYISLLKMETTVVKSRMLISFVSFIGISIIISLIFLFYESNAQFCLNILDIMPTILLIMAWHYSISIFKKEKIIFILLLLLVLLLSLFNKIWVYISIYGGFIGLFPYFLILSGMSCILLAEEALKRSGLLNYV